MGTVIVKVLLSSKDGGSNTWIELKKGSVCLSIYTTLCDSRSMSNK